MSKNYWLVIVFSLVTVSGVSGLSAKETLEELWADTPLNFDYVKKVGFDQALCTETALQFFACFNGVNEALSAVGSAYQLRPEGWKGTTKLISDFGGLDLVQEDRTKDEKPTSKAEALQEYRTERKDLFNAVQKTYALKRGENVNWTEIISFLAREGKAAVAPSLINGYLEVADDPHSMIIPKKYLDGMNGSGDQELVGIGVQITQMEEKFFVDLVLEGSPAESAGLQRGDQILQVDGEALKDLDVSTLVSKIRGAEGTPVRLSIKRGQEDLELEIIRKKVIRKNVTSSKLTYEDRKLGYVKLNEFTAESCEAVRSSIQSLEAWGQEGMILDLRFNGGGQLNAAVCIASLFVGNKVIVSMEEDFLVWKRLASYRFSEAAQPETTKPLVVLVNSRSASASEIVSGALQDLNRAWIVGERTFGKGTAQGIQRLRSMEVAGLQLRRLDDLFIKRTASRYFLPSQRSIEALGIRPEIEVYSRPGVTEEDRDALRQEDYYWIAPQKEAEVVSPRASRVEALQNCMTTAGRADQIYHKTSAGPLREDYQKLKSLDVLICDVLKETETAKLGP